MLDTFLAVIHHLLAFGLVTTVAIELALTKPGLDGPVLKRLGGIDAGYGLMALLILAVGLARVYWGGKGEAYYAANGWFWAKMAAFGLAGLLSIAPTMAFLRWRKRVKANPNALPSPAEIAGVRRFLVLEFLLLLLVPAFAAVMARHTTAS